ncbi:related to archipelago beta form (F-box-WD40 repeat protein), partial [Serendipita indica DSM 11827]
MSASKSAKSKSRTDQDLSGSSARGETSKKDRLIDTANLGLEAAATISESSDILAPLKAACRTTKLILEVIQTVQHNQDDWNDVIQRLEEYMTAIENQIDSFENYPPEERVVDEAFSEPLIHYVRLLEDFHSMVSNMGFKRKRTGLGALASISRVKVDAETIRKFHRDIEDRHRQFMGALGLFTASRLQVVERHTKAILKNVDKSALQDLPLASFVASSVHTTCLQGTRQAVLQTISHWAESVTDKPIFWLCDIAGSGKSTVAMSATARWRTEGMLGGQFFFSMTNSEASTTDKFCSTMARELAQHMPALAPHIAEAVTENPAIMRGSFDEQFRTLVTDHLRHRPKPIILVIDAIDECKSAAQRRELVETLSTAVRQCRNLRIFMTSRPDPVIEAVLGSLSIKSKLEDRLHDITHRDNIDDIAIYVHQSLNQVLSEDKIQRLVAKANGLFIWASTACRMINNQSTLNTPESIYDRLMSLEESGAIDGVYDLVFERTDKESYTVLCHMLAILLVAFEPLTIGDMEDV